MKAIIGITDWEQTKQELLDFARRVDAGEAMPEADYHLGFPDTAHLLAELPPRRLDTLRTIKALGPVSVYAVAKHLARNYSNVHADVQKLLELGLAEKSDDGRIVMPWDDVVVQVNASLLLKAA
jgi:predicted transcriptional regulator